MTSQDLSPHAMADAVLQEAMKERESVPVANGKSRAITDSNAAADEEGAEHRPTSAKRSKTDTSLMMNEDEDIEEKLLAAWNGAKEEQELEVDIDKAAAATMSLVSAQIEGLIRGGLEAFHRWENASREVKLLKEDIKGKDMELEHLRAAEEKSRTTISVSLVYRASYTCKRSYLFDTIISLILMILLALKNLLRASEASKADAREASRAALAEAGLRADLSVMTSKRDEALAHAEESKRKVVLMEEEVGQLKKKLSRVTQEKIKMERDQRA